LNQKWINFLERIADFRVSDFGDDLSVIGQQPVTPWVVAACIIVILLLLWRRSWRQTALALDRQDLLRQHLKQYATVLQHMSQAVCLFDAGDNLLFANAAFRNLYDLAENCSNPGTPYDTILREAAARGHFPGQPLDRLLWERLTFVARREHDLFRERLADGRTLEVHHIPLEGGGWLKTYTDMSRLVQAEQQSALAVRHDALTRFPNRDTFEEYLSHVLANADARRRAGVLAIGVERLEAVNGLFGRGFGDRLLQHVAQRLRACTRAGDRVARLAYNVFGLMRPNLTGRTEAEQLAQRMIGTLNAPFDISGQSVRVRANIGMALAPGEDARPDGWIHFAELAMHESRSEGPGRWSVFTPDMRNQERAHLRVEHELAGAIEREEFEVFYQPLVDLCTRRIASFEALVRWRHPVDGLLLPGMFIPVAEASGLMAALGRLVLRRACRDAAGWPPEIRVAVNMSATQLRSRAAVEMVKSALLEAWLPPKRLEIELTESHFLDHGTDGLRVLQMLRDLGIRVALDDFGTGYASLSSLLDFRFDKIKIDRSFIEGMAEDSQRFEIVRGMIRLANNLGISVVAEGAQTTQQLAMLKSEGCTEVQSFLLGAPMPASAVADVLKRQDVLQALVA
jgi:diguanylate cyclase (GGDEF)-like protein